MSVNSAEQLGAHVRIAPGDVPNYVAGMTLEAFKAALQKLFFRGFPKPDPDIGNFELDAIDAWRRERHPHINSDRESERDQP